MRLFLAVNLTDAARAILWRATTPLRAAAPSVSWVREELYHFTVKFLGECARAQVEQIRLALEAVASRHAPLILELQGAGAFPNFRRPRVVWIGTTDASAMERLTSDVEHAMLLLGFPRETRAFTAHLTIGRVKRELDLQQGVALERAAKALDLGVSVTATSVDLMSSEISRGGPTYHVVARCALLARDEAVERRESSAH